MFYLVQPFLNIIFGKMSDKVVKISSYIIIGVVGIDFIITMLGYIIK